MSVQALVAQLSAQVAAVAALPLTGDAAQDLADARLLSVAAEQLAQRLRGIAAQALGIVEAADPEGVSWWWRDALGITGEAAGHAVRRARGLRSLPRAADAVVHGRLSLEQAAALLPLVDALPAAVVSALEESLVDDAEGRSVERISQVVRTQIVMHRDSDHEREQVDASERQYLRHRSGPDGMLHGSFALPLERVEGLLTYLETMSRRDGLQDRRTARQRRADALCDLGDLGVRWGDLPEAGGQRAHVSYVMDADFAAGISGAQPPQAAWTGPQTRGFLEALCCDARISRVLLDTSGQVARLESLTGEITAAQRRAVSARDRCCVARGCSRPPAFCDIHHLVSRQDGGPTELGNLVLLCRRHHVMWHRGALRLEQLRVPWLAAESPGYESGSGDPPDEPRAGPTAA